MVQKRKMRVANITSNKNHPMLFCKISYLIYLLVTFKLHVTCVFRSDNLNGDSLFKSVTERAFSFSPRAVMIHGVPVKTYNALQNHIIVLLLDCGLASNKIWCFQRFGFCTDNLLVTHAQIVIIRDKALITEDIVRLQLTGTHFS